MKKFEAGEILETTVVAFGRDCVFIDLGLKSEGIVDLSEFTDDDGNVSIKEGDKIKVFFLSDNGEEIKFTTRLGGNTKDWKAKNAGPDTSALETAYSNAIPVEGKVEKEIKGGFEVTVSGIRCFCPYSQMGFKEKQDPSYYIGRNVQFLISEFKNEGKNIVLSNRALGEKKEAEKLENLSSSINAGDEIEGHIVSLQSYGAFVDIGDFEALLPMSEISHQRIKDASELLQVGQIVKVKVLDADWKRKRVSVSLKALEEDPWNTAASKIKIGDKITGKIVRIADFGLFVNLDKGIDGLVHRSKLDGIDRNTNLSKKFKIGDDFAVIVEEIDSESKRIALVPATSKEQDDTAAKYLSSQENDDDGDTYNPFAALLKR